MIINIDTTKYKIDVSNYVCDFHKKNPGVFFAGCTCTTSYILKNNTNKDSR